MAFCCSASVYVPSPLPKRASARRSTTQLTGAWSRDAQLPHRATESGLPAVNAPWRLAPLGRATKSEEVADHWKSGFAGLLVSAYRLYTFLIFKKLRKSAKMVQSSPFARTPLVSLRSRTLVQGRPSLFTGPDGCEKPKF